MCGWCIYRDELKPLGLPPPNVLSDSERECEKANKKRSREWHKVHQGSDPKTTALGILMKDRDIHKVETLAEIVYHGDPEGVAKLTPHLLRAEAEGYIERLRSNRWRKRLTTELEWTY